MSAIAYAGPGTTTYQAKIIKPDGYPLEATSVNFKFTILDPLGSCILYAETYSAVNMSSTAGLVSFALGSGLKSFPASATTFENVFSNITPALTCDAGGPGIYTPGASDTRKIVMQFHDGAGWQTLPAMSINAVPYAMYANDSQKLGGVSATAFVQDSEIPTCAGGQALFYNGTMFSCVAVGGGGVTSSTITAALGFTPADGASVTAVISDVSTLTTYASNVSATVFSVSSTVSSLANSVSTLAVSTAASFSALTSSQWLTSGTTISYNSGSVGLGVSAPAAPLHVVKEWTTTGNLMGVFDSYGTDPSRISIRRANGSIVSPTAITSGQSLGNLNFRGHNGTDFSAGALAAITAFAAENFSPTNMGTALTFATTAVSGTGSSEKMRLSPAGYLGIGTVSPVTALDVSGGVRIGIENATCDTSYAGTLRYNSGVVEYCNGTSWSAFGVSGAGILAINGLTSGSQTFATGSAGTTPNVSSTGTIHTFNFPYASVGTTTAGVISNSDYQYFFNKAEAVSITTLSSTVAAVSSSVSTLSNTMASSFASVVSSQWVTNGANIYYAAGFVGVGAGTPNARLHLSSGSTTVAPLKITSGSLLSAAQSGAIEYDGYNLYFTDGTNSRYQLVGTPTPGIYDSVSALANSSGNILLYPGAGTVTVSASTASINSNTGALVIKGGLGVAGAANVAGALNASGAITTSAMVKATGYRANQGAPDNNDISTNGYAFGDDGDTGIFSPGSGGANGVLAFYANNGERLRINGYGIGIGTALPTAQLQVQKSSVASAALMIGGGLSGGPRIQTYGLDADPLGFMGLGSDMAGGPYESSNYFPVGNSTNGSMTFGSYNGASFSEKMRITASGRVGIGTSSPQAFFQVGDIAANTSAFIYAPGASGVTRLTADATANWIQSGQNLTNDSKKDLKFTSINGVSTWMTIQASSGNVGIGTTAPTAKLHIEGNAPTGYINSAYGNHFVINASGDGYGGSASPLVLSGDPVAGTGWKFVRGYADANGTPVEKFYIDGTGGGFFDGNVGIGTSTTTYKLNVRGEANFGPNSAWGENFIVGIDIPYHATGHTAATVGSTNGNLHLEAKNGYDTYINHYTSGTGRVLIATGNSVNGKVGVGTTSPNSKFDVAGDMTTRGAALRQTIGDTGAAPQWIRLGRWTSAQQGRNALIHIEGGTGYNADHVQISSADIQLRTSNGASTDGNGFCAAATVSVRGHASLLTAVKIVANAAGCAATAYDVYIYSSLFFGVGSFFTVDTDYTSTWTNNLLIGVADPGAASSSVFNAPLQNMFQNTSYFNGGSYFTGGNVGINVSVAPAYNLDVSGTFRVSGQAYTNTGTANFSVLSDIRYKDIKGSYDRGLAEILKIETIRYKYKLENPLGSDSANEYVGVSAQNIQQVIPEAVELHKDKEHEYLTMNTSPILWTMLNAIKQLYAKVVVLFENDRQQSREIASSNSRVEKLEQENQNLKKENEAVKARLERLEKLLESK